MNTSSLILPRLHPAPPLFLFVAIGGQTGNVAPQPCELTIELTGLVLGSLERLMLARERVAPARFCSFIHGRAPQSQGPPPPADLEMSFPGGAIGAKGSTDITPADRTRPKS